MRFIVTGGAGFIGSHLSESLLNDGHEITIFDNFNDYYALKLKERNISQLRDHAEVVHADIRDARAVDQAVLAFKPDAIVHLAARAGVRPSLQDPRLYISTNIDGTFNLLNAAKEHDVSKFVFASSSSVYGVNKKVPFAESDQILRTISPYAATKVAGEHLCSNYSHLYDIQMSCLRFFTVYGSRQRPDLAIAKFTKNIDEGKSIDLYGDGTTARDYTYVEDIIQGVRAAIDYDATPYEIFNLGGSATTQLHELLSLIETHLGKKANINRLPEQPGDVPITYADISKAKGLLGYTPDTPIATGIQKYVEWYQAQKD